MKTVDLVERIEGEAKLICSWKNNKVSDARIDFLNFRGFEYILEEKITFRCLNLHSKNLWNLWTSTSKSNR